MSANALGTGGRQTFSASHPPTPPVIPSAAEGSSWILRKSMERGAISKTLPDSSLGLRPLGMTMNSRGRHKALQDRERLLRTGRGTGWLRGEGVVYSG